jgi:hypothetical protein
MAVKGHWVRNWRDNAQLRAGGLFAKIREGLPQCELTEAELPD